MVFRPFNLQRSFAQSTERVDNSFWSFVKPDQRPKTVVEAYMNQDEDSEDQISDEEEEEEDMDVE